MPSETGYPEDNQRAASRGVLSAMSSRGFRMYWAGAFVSSIGSWLQMTAVLWFARNIGSNTLVGFVNLVGWIPVLFFGLFAGVMSDRMNRRRVMLVTQAVMMVCSILMGVCISTSVKDLTLVIFLGISGIAYAIFTPVWVSVIPLLVKKEDLLSGATLNNVQFNVARFIGPIVGGLLLLYFSAYVPFYANAVTFGAFMLLILFSRAELPAPGPKKEGVAASVVDGFRYVIENGWMGRVMLTICALSFFGFSFIVLLPSVCKQVLHVGEHYYGFLMGMTGLGAVAGMIAVGYLRRVGLKSMMFVGSLLTSGFLLAFALSPYYWLSCILAAGAGGSFVVFNSSAAAAVQRSASQEMMGRVSSMLVVAYIGVFPVGGLLLGYLADVFSIRASLLLAGFACVAVSLCIPFLVSVPEESAAESTAEMLPGLADAVPGGD
jgi:MFS family permease